MRWTDASGEEEEVPELKEGGSDRETDLERDFFDPIRGRRLNFMVVVGNCNVNANADAMEMEIEMQMQRKRGKEEWQKKDQ